MKKQFFAVLAVVAVMGGAMLAAPSPVSAHGSCDPYATDPVKDAGFIIAKVRLDCNGNQHDRYDVEVVLQKQAADGTWDTVAGPDIDQSFNVTIAHASVSKSCTNGTYRSRLKSALVYNNSGTLVHPGPFVANSGTNSVVC